MRDIQRVLLGSTALLAATGVARAADLPIKAAVPIEYVRVCTAYGAGFFYIPGTETCLRVSGRARYEMGYLSPGSRNAAGAGDTTQYRGLARFSLDARTQTSYGTLRAFLRLEAASRTGESKMASGTQLRIGNAYTATGQDQYGRTQTYIVPDKAFVQFAGLTAGRASSFFDFYAHDYEIIGSSLGSDVASTNLLAYTQLFGEGFSATVSMEDPSFRKNPVYSASYAASTTAGSAASALTATTAPTPIILGTNAAGNATAVAFVDAVERTRMPDFVGALRYDAPWGSAQISGAVRAISIGGFTGQTLSSASGTYATATTLSSATAAALYAARGISSGAQTDYGWAIQGGLKLNLPFIAPGDGLYLQGAYGEGSAMYTGITSFTGSYLSNATVFPGNAFNQYLSDAIVNPLTGKLELSTSFTVVASYLHYWAPEWRSAFYGSYGEIAFSQAARQAVSQTAALIGAANTVAPASYLTNALGYGYSAALRDTSQIVTGASLIWSPVKDLDIGVEGQYIRTALKSGKAYNADKTGTVTVNGVSVPLYPVSAEDTFQARFRVQRDF
ncbi:porin [Methylobacterium organophilum]|uniref:Porin n=1 Tax=Methylobacterium organophilum TaxID=410 RepID=A0ABQ4T5I2_METOR|nr:porin [Methylobacterium organophilum]GJE25892.1 hypothetical protein LKMONMHP_0735 [Methylobacterium organophilum]